MKSKPEINRNTSKLIEKQKEEYKPIHHPDRLTRELDARKEKRRLMKEKQDKEREEAEEAELREIEKHRVGSQHKRSFNSTEFNDRYSALIMQTRNN